MMHGDSAYVCNLSNTTGMQLLQCISCGRGTAFMHMQ